MPRDIKAYPNYDKQLISMDLVDSADYDEMVQVCVSRFGWRVARAFLSMQANQRDTFCMQRNSNNYELPDDTEWDTIQASIAETLNADLAECQSGGPIMGTMIGLYEVQCTTAHFLQTTSQGVAIPGLSQTFYIEQGDYAVIDICVPVRVSGSTPNCLAILEFGGEQRVIGQLYFNSGVADGIVSLSRTCAFLNTYGQVTAFGLVSAYSGTTVRVNQATERCATMVITVYKGT